MAEPLESPTAAVAIMMDLLLQDSSLTEATKADYIRDLGCLKLQILCQERRPVVLQGLLDSLARHPKLQAIAQALARVLS